MSTLCSIKQPLLCIVSIGYVTIGLGRSVKIIPEFSLFQESLQRPIPTHLRVNRLLIEPASVVHLLEEKGIQLIRSSRRYDTLYLAPGLASPGNLLEYFLGHIHPQALTSAIASIALTPRENSHLLDMCAAPGGKSAHCAQLMNNTGLIVSNGSSKAYCALIC